MNKQFEALYSENWVYLFLFFVMLFVAGFTLLTFWWIGIVSLILAISFSVAALVFLDMHKRAKNQTGIAVEIIDDVLIIHKKGSISIPLNEIQKIHIHDGSGSFDIIVKTSNRKVSLHCFIQQERQKKLMLIDLLKSKNVNVSTYDLAW